MGFTMVPVEHHLRVQSHSVVLESPPCCPVIVISMHIAFDLVPLMSQAATTSFPLPGLLTTMKSLRHGPRSVMMI